MSESSIMLSLCSNVHQTSRFVVYLEPKIHGFCQSISMRHLIPQLPRYLCLMLLLCIRVLNVRMILLYVPLWSEWYRRTYRTQLACLVLHSTWVDHLPGSLHLLSERPCLRNALHTFRSSSHHFGFYNPEREIPVKNPVEALREVAVKDAHYVRIRNNNWAVDVFIWVWVTWYDTIWILKRTVLPIQASEFNRSSPDSQTCLHCPCFDGWLRSIQLASIFVSRQKQQAKTTIVLFIIVYFLLWEKMKSALHVCETVSFQAFQHHHPQERDFQ